MSKLLVDSRSRLASPWVFFAAVFGWTWLFWFAALLTGQSMDSGAGIILLVIGVAGPSVGGIIFTHLTREKAARRAYWKRAINFRQIPLKWYAIILLLPLLLNIISALLDRLLGGTGAEWGELATQITTSPLSVIPSIVFFTVVPILEELGWRYALDRLQESRSALVSSLILGVLWSLWHFPLFLIPGTYQSGLGVWTADFWVFMLGIVPLTFVVTWIYNNTRFSILSIILFHAAINFAGELIAVTTRADTIYIVLYAVLAIAIPLIWGARTMAGETTIAPAEGQAVEAMNVG